MAVTRSDNRLNIYSEASNDNKKEKEEKLPSNISKKLDILDQKMDSLYQDIYITRSDNKHNLDDIISRMDDSIDRLQTNDIAVSGMSELLRRIEKKDSTTAKRLMNSVEDLFNDQALINTITTNTDIHRFISGQNYQYDMICKYIPKLDVALEIKRDNVLCSDNFSKNFLNPKSIKSNKSAIELFSANTDKLNTDYDLQNFFEKIYMNVSKYGEDFIYVVPYDIAFKRLLKRANYRKNTARLGQISFFENGDISSTGRKVVSANVVTCVKESFAESEEYHKYINTIKSQTNINEESEYNFKGYEVNLHFNDTNIVLDKVNEYVIVKDKSELDKFTSLASMHEDTVLKEKGLEYNSVYSDVSKKNTKLDKLSQAVAMDGLIIPDNLSKDPDKVDKEFTGAVLERLPRENIIPVYIGEKKLLGYYYFDFKEDSSACGYCGGHHSVMGLSNAQSYAYEMTQDQQELAIRFIASKISSSIDTHFINANKDLKEEIYAILQYNDKFDLARTNDIGVSFIPAEDIVHCYSEIDEHTHRGISDLQKSVVPAMLYILLYLTDIIGKITRSTDKRIYYVKQNVEQNVARTMMNVVQQIKKGNLGMRQIESMNNILNIVGKYNDFIIPVGQSGDSPVDFQTMQGQNIETPTDIMDRELEEAINSTGVPIELVNSVLQTDYATRFTMSNTRFLKSVFTRQTQTERWISIIYTKLYNYEFDENYPLIKIVLPPPTYLTVTNTQQMLDNIVQLADKLSDVVANDVSDEVKSEFKRLYLINNLGTYIDFADLDRLLDTARANIESKVKPSTDDGEASDDYDEL